MAIIFFTHDIPAGAGQKTNCLWQYGLTPITPYGADKLFSNLEYMYNEVMQDIPEKHAKKDLEIALKNLQLVKDKLLKKKTLAQKEVDKSPDNVKKKH